MFQGSSFRERLEAVIWASDDEVDGDVQPAANDNNDSDVPLVANDCNDEFDTDGLMNGSCMPEVIEEKAPVEGICLRDLALRAYSLSWKEHNKVTKGEGEVDWAYWFGVYLVLYMLSLLPVLLFIQSRLP